MAFIFFNETQCSLKYFNLQNIHANLRHPINIVIQFMIKVINCHGRWKQFCVLKWVYHCNATGTNSIFVATFILAVTRQIRYIVKEPGPDFGFGLWKLCVPLKNKTLSPYHPAWYFMSLWLWNSSVVKMQDIFGTTFLKNAIFFKLALWLISFV